MTEYFYVQNGTQQGPVGVARLGEMLALGEKGGGISGKTLIWEPNMVGWAKLEHEQKLWVAVQQRAFALTPPPGSVLPKSGAETAASRASACQQPKVTSSGTARFGGVSGGAAVGGGAGGGNSGGGPMRSAGRIAAASGAGASPSAKGVGGAAGAKTGGKVASVKSLLKGWLPNRTNPSDLVRRGILQMDPTDRISSRGRNRGGTGGGGGGGGANAATAAVAGPAPTDVFGNALEVVLAREDTSGGVPLVVRVLMERLREDDDAGLRSEGIFRIPGDSNEMQYLRREINARPSEVRGLVARCDNLHSVAGMLKMFFREIKEPILPFELYDDFLAASAAAGSAGTDSSGRVDTAAMLTLRQLLARLPPGHEALLGELVGFLCAVVSRVSESKMGVGNVAAVFAPNLLRPRHETIETLRDTVTRHTHKTLLTGAALRPNRNAAARRPVVAPSVTLRPAHRAAGPCRQSDRHLH